MKRDPISIAAPVAFTVVASVGLANSKAGRRVVVDKDSGIVR